MYILGKTGTGKSTLIKNMTVSDIRDGNGLAVIDPHGDLAEDLLNFIPRTRIKDVIYFNPADLEFPIAFNPLNKVHPDYHHLVASGLISVFKKIWSESWGPRLAYILRNSILALLDYPESTLLDISKLMIDTDFRGKVLKQVKNPEVKDFWLKEFENYSAWLRSEAISPLQNKVGEFLCTRPVRNIFCQKESAFSFRKIMDEGKILIVNLSKGKIGEDMCSLLGAMIITRMELAALSRADTGEEKRKPFYLYVDEMHNFITRSFAYILSESRKYGLSLILTHQYIDQLDEKIRSAVFGNVGTLISFRVGHEDAQVLAREFRPVFDETDLVNLSNYRIYIKLMIDGITSKPFSAVTLPPPNYQKSYREPIISNSRRQYARPRYEVEKALWIKRKMETCVPRHKTYAQKLPL